jgi:beta-phosphoglucomutase
MSQKIKAVLFDMDGVLIDAKEWHFEALNRALGLFGFSISRYDHLVTYDGLPTRKKLEMLSVERALPRSLHRFLNDLKQKFTMELVYSKCHPVFQHEYALARLKKEGMLLAVCSNSVRQTVDVMMDRAELKQYLDLQLSNEDVSRPKPDPEIYVTAAKRLGLRPEECLVVEDNEHGIAAARASGARVMVVTDVADVTYDRIMSSVRGAL